MEISILIVDDDKILVDKLEETVNWEKIGISMVFTAYNIRQAKKILEEFSIHMMLCDIDMPQGSGLELLEWMRSQNMDTECIFLSSYANFAYAQKALRLSSREYLLKPISNHELEQVLSNIAENVRSSQASDDLHESGLSKQAFWEKVLLGYPEEEAAEKEILLEKFYEGEQIFYLQIVKVFLKERNAEGQKKHSLYKFVLDNVNAEAVVPMADNEWVMVMKPEQGNSIREEGQKLAAYLNTTFLLPISIYMGAPCSLQEVPFSWKNLKKIENEELPKKNGVLMEEDVIHTGKCSDPPWEIWQKMMAEPQGVQTVQIAMKEYLQHIYTAGYLNIKHLRQFIMGLKEFLYIYLAEQRLKFNQMFDVNEFELRETEAYIFFEAGMEFVDFLFQTLGGNLQYDQDNAVERVKEYISQNLDKELSRAVLAKVAFLSEDYVSKIFKSKTGMSLTNYIALKRVEKAKEYLEYSNLTVSKIALEVGYNNFSYFSKTFRDITGMTPNEYRNIKKRVKHN